VVEIFDVFTQIFSQDERNRSHNETLGLDLPHLETHFRRQRVERNSCNVLVVEDEGLIANEIESRLNEMGHRVVATVSTGKEALDRAPEADIVLMDIRINGPIDGIETAALIREGLHLPVIFLTAHADRSTIDRAKLSSPFGYILKPIPYASLNSSIEIALDKHRAERQLQAREELLRSTLDSVADAVVATDHLSRVLMLNGAAEALTGWTQTAAEGQPLMSVLRLVDGESGELAEDPVPLAILKDEVLTLDRSCQLISRDGRQVMIAGSAVPVKSSGVTLGTVLTFRDVSAQLWEEKQLRQSLEVQAAGRMAARVSDEYTSPLAIIRNQSENLQRHFREYSPARQSLEKIRESVTEAEALTDLLSAFAARQVSQQPEVLSINGMLRRMSRMIESVSGARIEYTLRPSRAAAYVRVDAAQLEWAIMKLILHASALMPEGGQLVIETGNADLPRLTSIASYVVLTLSHTGTEPELEKLFEPRSIAGGGMTLAMVHGIVTEHGGYISAQPTSAGYRFEMLLPRAEEMLLPKAGLELGKVPAILLVDYRERVRAQLHNFLEAEGYNLLEAIDHREALKLGEVHDRSLDLLIAEAADADRISATLLKNHPKLLVLRVIDHPGTQSETAANEIRLPFTQTALLKKVAELLGTRSAERVTTSAVH
jgi:two-component system cell cycle sensor histidine kinase/response regulator CckA